MTDTQASLFDAAISDRLKEEGMRSAAYNNADKLALARLIALQLARDNGDVHADQVGEVLWDRYKIKTLGPAAGSIFKESCWRFTGEFVKSARKKNHSRLLRVWRHDGGSDE